jgi:hypothetical protein
VLTRTYTKTFAIYGAWASTVPLDRRDCVAPCNKPHVHNWDVCAEPQCDEQFLPDEVCYSVTELRAPADHPGELWVCWRHVQPDEGPIRITREQAAS